MLFAFLLVAGFSLVAWNQLTRVHLVRYLLNPDAVSYIDVADRYASLDLTNAINGYWSPLVSWLLTIPIALSFDPVVSFHYLNAVVAWCSILVLYLLLRQIGTESFTSGAIALAASVPIASWSIRSLSPDLLFVLAILVSLLAMVRFTKAPTVKNAFIFGLSGSLIYFSKAFGLPLFILAVAGYVVASFMATGSWDRQVYNRRNISAFTLSLGIPAIAWIAALSLKYDQLMYSSSGTQNLWAISPLEKRGRGLPDLVFFGDINFWYDPTNRSIPPWSPLDTWADFLYWTGRFRENLFELWDYLGPFYVLALFSGGAMAVYHVTKQHHASRKYVPMIVYAWIMMAVQPIVYSLIAVEPRYLWAPFLLVFLLPMAAWRDVCRPLVPILCAIGLVATPAIAWMDPGTSTPQTIFAASRTFPTVAASRDRATGLELRPLICGQRIAASGQGSTSMYIAHYGDGAYHGAINTKNAEPGVIEEQLAELHISVFFLWGSTDDAPPSFLDGFNEVQVLGSKGLRVFILDQPRHEGGWIGASCS